MITDLMHIEPSGVTPTCAEIRWPAKWLRKTLKRLSAIARLPVNWDSYGASQLNTESLALAKEFLQQIARITPDEPQVTPNASGNVCVSWCWDEDCRELSIEFFQSGRMGVFYSTPELDDEFTTDDLRNLLALIPNA